MLERLRLVGPLAAGLSLAACHETPLAPTDLPETHTPVHISTAPEPTYAVESTGVTFMADGEVREFAYAVSFDLILRADRDNDLGVTLTSDSIVMQQLGESAEEGAGGGVDRETYRFASRSGDGRIGPGEETARAFDIWYTLPNGGGQALIAVSLDFVDDMDRPFTEVHQVPVEPLPER